MPGRLDAHDRVVVGEQLRLGPLVDPDLARPLEGHRLHGGGRLSVRQRRGCGAPIGSRAVADALYVRDGDRFAPSELTRGPWDPDAQHAGPPAALLGRALERCEPREDARIGADHVRDPRPGAARAADRRGARGAPGTQRRAAGGGAERAGRAGDARVSAWRLRTVAVELEPEPTDEQPPPGPEHGAHRDFFPTGADVGYHTAIEYRFVRGGFMERRPGDGLDAHGASRWSRASSPRRCRPCWPPPTPATASARRSTTDRYVFINTELTVHLLRYPDGRVGLPRLGHHARRRRHRAHRDGALGRARADRRAPRRRCSCAPAEPGAAPALGAAGRLMLTAGSRTRSDGDGCTRRRC